MDRQATPDSHFVKLEKVKYPLVNQFYKRVYNKGLTGENEALFILKNELELFVVQK
ncbi:hypothetical protein [Psychromonas hadalis]|uniref:hypothetical protein n=1 Tax=Psychromonas hadalis TaxID=211669 RepID=UPI0003B4959C|nr:hypothetical protein [Psychromonas hadalis]